MMRSYFVALAFIRDEGDIVPGDAVECPNAMDAALQAQVLSHAAGNIGAVAYSRTENDVGVFSEASAFAMRATCHLDPRRKMTGSSNFSLEMFWLHLG